MLVRVRWLWRRRKNSGFFQNTWERLGILLLDCPKRPQNTSVTDADLDVFWSTSGSRGVLGALSGQPPKCLQDVPRLGATSGGILGVPARFRTTFASFPFCECAAEQQDLLSQELGALSMSRRPDGRGRLSPRALALLMELLSVMAYGEN